MSWCFLSSSNKGISANPRNVFICSKRNVLMEICLRIIPAYLPYLLRASCMYLNKNAFENLWKWQQWQSAFPINHSDRCACSKVFTKMHSKSYLWWRVLQREKTFRKFILVTRHTHILNNREKKPKGEEKWSKLKSSDSFSNSWNSILPNLGDWEHQQIC